jgi:hypothetical protein
VRLGCTISLYKTQRNWIAVEALSFCQKTKFILCQSARKVMAFVFWDADGVIHVEFMPSANADAYCSFL